jgi:hypothetical protein
VLRPFLHLVGFDRAFSRQHHEYALARSVTIAIAPASLRFNLSRMQNIRGAESIHLRLPAGNLLSRQQR